MTSPHQRGRIRSAFHTLFALAFAIATVLGAVWAFFTLWPASWRTSEHLITGSAIAVAVGAVIWTRHVTRDARELGNHNCIRR